jgi:hypothetical protein
MSDDIFNISLLTVMNRFLLFQPQNQTSLFNIIGGYVQIFTQNFFNTEIERFGKIFFQFNDLCFGAFFKNALDSVYTRTHGCLRFTCGDKK